MKKINLTSDWWLIAALAGIKLVLHLLTNTNYELHRDAYLYLALGDHLDFGYIAVPPLIAVLAKLATGLLGGSVFAVRLFPALAGAASVILVSLIVKNLGGRRLALVLAGAAFILSPAFLRTNTLFQPVAFNQLFWLLSGYLIVKLLQTRNPKYWLIFGAVWGMAFLMKYSIVFFAAAFMLALAASRERRLLRSKYLLWGAGIGLLLILPNLLWQHAHNWPIVAHMQELRQTQLVNVRLDDFLIMQLLMNVQAVVIWLAGLLYLLFAPSAKSCRVLGLTFLFLLMILLALSGKSDYTLGAYPLLFAAGGVALERLKRLWRLLMPTVAVLNLLIALPLLPYGLPLLPLDQMLAYAAATRDSGLEGALRWEDGRIHPLPQDYADMTGWRELTEIVRRAYDSLNETEQAQCAIYASNYGEAGAIKYFGKKYGLPEPVSFNASFLLWAPERVDISAFIYVNSNLGEDIRASFADIVQVGRITNPYARESGLQVFLCRSPRPEFAVLYASKAGRLKDRFRRK